MSTFLPQTKAKDLVRVAKQLGFELDRQKGSHAIGVKSCTITSGNHSVSLQQTAPIMLAMNNHREHRMQNTAIPPPDTDVVTVVPRIMLRFIRATRYQQMRSWPSSRA
jgi:hypothetical protein